MIGRSRSYDAQRRAGFVVKSKLMEASYIVTLVVQARDGVVMWRWKGLVGPKVCILLRDHNSYCQTVTVVKKRKGSVSFRVSNLVRLGRLRKE